jgi:DNA-binding NarL/FixJ family response regulator
MSYQEQTAAEAIYTPLEVEAVRYAQSFYGYRAKEAAAELASNLGRTESGNNFVEQMAAMLDLMDAREKQIVGAHLIRLNKLFSSVAERTLQDVTLLELVGKESQAENVKSNANLDNAAIIISEQPESDLQVITTPKQADVELFQIGDKQEDIARPLNHIQQRWFYRLLGEDSIQHIARVDLMTKDQRTRYIDDICSLYEGLTIYRLGPNAKKLNAEDLTLLMKGHDYQDIANMHNAGRSIIQRRIIRIADSIASRVESEKLISMIDAAFLTESSTSVSLTTIASRQPEAIDRNTNREISREEEKWLKKVFGSEDYQEVINLLPEQKSQFAEQLSSRLSSYTLRRSKAVKTSRRISQMRLLLEGKTQREIAEQSDQPIQSVKSDLHNTANVLKTHLTTLDIKLIFEKARL